MAKVEKNCGSCGWAEWPKNKLGHKMKKNNCGECKCPVPPVPDSLLDHWNKPLKKRHVVSEAGTECPKWMPEDQAVPLAGNLEADLLLKLNEIEEYSIKDQNESEPDSSMNSLTTGILLAVNDLRNFILARDAGWHDLRVDPEDLPEEGQMVWLHITTEGEHAEVLDYRMRYSYATNSWYAPLGNDLYAGYNPTLWVPAEMPPTIPDKFNKQKGGAD